jgi:hypothetical protein
MDGRLLRDKCFILLMHFKFDELNILFGPVFDVPCFYLIK